MVAANSSKRVNLFKGDSVLEIISFGQLGVSRHVEELEKEIENHKEFFLGVVRISDGNDNYSFAAVFKDKCVVGKYSALIHEWGTNDGKSGVGGSYFRSFNRFLNEHNYAIVDAMLSNEDSEKIGYMKSSENRLFDWEDRVKIWQKYLNHKW